MGPTDPHDGSNADPQHDTWQHRNRVAAVLALLIFCVALTDVVMMFFEGEAKAPGSQTAVVWFELLETHRFLGLRNLGLFNIINTLLEIPLFLALCGVHRGVEKAWSAVAVILLAVGTAVYVSQNTIFSMHALSLQYAAATTEAQKAALEATGQTLLTLGEDLTPGMFMGFFLTELAGLVMAVVMLRAGVFGRWTGIMGIVGFGALLVFNILAAFVPSTYSVAVGLGALGGLVMMAWYILVARRLFRLEVA